MYLSIINAITMKRLVSIIFSSVIVCVSYALAMTPDSIASLLWKQAELFPQEKLYTQTDRAEYVTGDTIWMRHHIVNALTGYVLQASRYVYVELVNPFGGITNRVMMRQDSHGFIYGYMPTTTDMPSGQYTLRAYTRYMANTTPEYLFVRPIRLRNIMENSVRITTEYSGNSLHITFTDPKSGNHIQNGNIKVASSDGDVAFTGNTADGINIHKLDVGSRQRYLLVQVGNYEEYLPVTNDKIDLQVMPEGGHMIMGKMCRVAYKTVARTGLGINMAAVVTDEKGTIVAENQKTHCGMGMFYITPEPDHEYKITCTSADGQTISTRLPKASDDIPALAISQNSNNIVANILSPDSGKRPSTLWLVVHQGGAPVYAHSVNDMPVLKFSRQLFHDGIVHFVLADQDMNIISERLVFVWKGNDVIANNNVKTISIGNKLHEISILLPDTVNANCAVSVTDAGTTCADTICDIVSTLLLSQELRGYIENPSWYFTDGVHSGQLDLLMMTQGWRRYDIPNILHGNVSRNTQHLESSMQISGMVTSDVSPKGKENVSVMMSSTRGGLADVAITDKNGRFCFKGFEMPDSTSYLLTSLSSKGSENVVLRIDSIAYPKMTKNLPFDGDLPAISNDTAMAKAANRIAAMHGRTIFLPEVDVVGRHKDKTYFESLAKLNGMSIKAETLQKETSKSVLEYLRMQLNTGLKYDYICNWFTYRDKASYFILNGTVWNGDELSYNEKALRRKRTLTHEEQMQLERLNEIHRTMTTTLESMRLKDVQQIDILKGQAAGTLPGITTSPENLSMAQSAIIITTRTDNFSALKNKQLLSILGYQRPMDFYNPRFNVPDDYSLRQTVYWNPSVDIVNGKASIQFMPNGSSEYRIKVEGVSKDGKIIDILKMTK